MRPRNTASTSVPARRGRPVEAHELDVAFHRRVVELADNEEASRVFESSQVMFLSLSLHDSIARPSASVRGAGHADIAKAVSTGDCTRTFEVMWRHFSKIIEGVERKLAEPAVTVAGRAAKTQRRGQKSRS